MSSLEPVTYIFFEESNWSISPKFLRLFKGAVDLDELDDEHEDNFDKIYKGEISKSGTAVLPSKRSRRIPEQVNFDSKSPSDKDSDIKK